MPEEKKRPDWLIVGVLIAAAAVCSGLMWLFENGWRLPW